MIPPDSFRYITLTDDTPGAYQVPSQPTEPHAMIFSASELCELEPNKFQIRQIETNGTVCSLFYANGQNIVHSNQSGIDPFSGIAFSCKKKARPDRSESYSIQTMLI